MSRKRTTVIASSQRQLRVGEIVRQALSDILPRAHFRDPDLAEANFTVTEVQPSTDLRHATVFVVPLGGENADALVAGLGRAAGYLRGEVNKRVSFRFSLQLNFELDRRFEAAAHIDELLRAKQGSDEEER